MKTRKKRILILFSDTGGGHRSAAEAIGEAFYYAYPNQAEIFLVDVFKDATPFPVNQTPKGTQCLPYNFYSFRAMHNNSRA